MNQQPNQHSIQTSAFSPWIVLGAASIAFHLWLIFSGLIPNLISRPVHMTLALPWIFLYGANNRRKVSSGAIICTAALLCCLYITLNQNALSDQYGYLSGAGQTLLAAILLLSVLEMARRAIGWPLPLVAALALLYGLLGHLIPGQFGYSGIPLKSFLGTLTITEGGLWGRLTGVSVNTVAVFIIFGAVLNAGEAGRGFMNLAAAAAGRLRGGAARVSVVASALFGSISGSASANVASTGAITLPAMKRLGYPPALAAAVEAVASSGGQIMPPLMGAGAFVMVELTGVPYNQIMAAALLPALLYFIAVWVGIGAYSRRYNLPPLPADQQPNAQELTITTLFFLVPFSVLLYGMFIIRSTPQFSACLAILAAALLLLVDNRLSFNLQRSKQRLYQVCLTAGQQIATIAAIILCASIIVGVLGITGLGVKITSLILSGSNNQLWPALGLTALACLILGMEVPTTAAYVICVSVAGPALQQLGLEPLQAHLFIFWFALLSTITPPVCGAVFIAASMVAENWLRVAGTAMALGIGLYLIPPAMIANPALLTLSATPALAVLYTIKVALGLVMISYAVIAPTKKSLRALLLIGGAMVIFIQL